MSPSEYPGVIIDGAVPRSDYERCYDLLAYAETLLGDGTEQKSRVGEYAQKLGDLRHDVEEPRIIYDGYFAEVEDDVINLINDLLPDDYVCTLGEAQPGDVVVRDISNDERLDQEGV